ncbi:hypothetical protein DL96DRAFT_1065550 [Flagelloscypha sp. PMI_526]|nr:hypothetical protein DL96DRAFT_1065550 [Flagelloscypha sp. PMI_526]
MVDFLSTIPPLKWTLVTIVLHAFLFGIFLVLAVLSSTILLLRGSKTGRQGSLWLHPLFVGGIILTVLVTAHWVLSLDRALAAALSESPTSFYRVHDPQGVILLALCWLSAMLCDLMVMYRLWVIYSRTPKVMIFPFCTISVLLVTASFIFYELARLKPDEGLYKPSLARWYIADGSFSFCTNVYCTILIAWKVWRTVPRVGQRGVAESRLLKTVLPIISQSTILYTGITAIYYIGYFAHLSIQWPILYIWPPVAGISFMLISTHIAMSWAVRSSPERIAVSSVQFQRSGQYTSGGTTTIELEGMENSRSSSVTRKNMGEVSLNGES